MDEIISGDKGIQKFLRNTFFGIAGIAFTTLLSLLQIEVSNFDKYLTNALYCISVIFPFSLIAGFLMAIEDDIEDSLLILSFSLIASVISIVIASLGLYFIIRHFSEIAGKIFLYSFGIIGGAFILYMEKIKKK